MCEWPIGCVVTIVGVVFDLVASKTQHNILYCIGWYFLRGFGKCFVDLEKF